MNDFWWEYFSEIRQFIQDEKKHCIIGLLLLFIVGYAIGGWIMAGLMLGFFLFIIFLTPLLSWKDVFDDD